MFVRLELKIDPTITAIATMLIAMSVVTLVAVALLMRKAGLLPRRSAEAG
jgi:ABC-type spermidine/putrescine transport system permease subunit II